MSGPGFLSRVFGSPDPEKLKAKRDFNGLMKLRATPQLVALLQDSDLKVRFAALEALAKLEDPSSFNAIADLLVRTPDSSQELRQRAARLLGRMGWQPDSDERKIFYYCAGGRAERCAELGPQAIPLIRKLYEKKRLSSGLFCTLIKQFEIPEAAQPLVDLYEWAVRNRDEKIRMQTVFALLRVGAPAKDPLNRALTAALKGGDEAFATAFADGGALTILADLPKG
jgi:hypothetical protein